MFWAACQSLVKMNILEFLRPESETDRDIATPDLYATLKRVVWYFEVGGVVF